MATENQLDYVRQNIKSIPASGWQRLAVEAGVSHRSLYRVQNENFDPQYSTVFNLYNAIKKELRRMKKCTSK